jgi:hypothetical protein
LSATLAKQRAVQARQLVEFVIAVADKAVHFDGLKQLHLNVETQSLDGHTAEFGKVSDPDHLKDSDVFIHSPAGGESSIFSTEVLILGECCTQTIHFVENINTL